MVVRYARPRLAAPIATRPASPRSAGSGRPSAAAATPSGSQPSGTTVLPRRTAPSTRAFSSARCRAWSAVSFVIASFSRRVASSGATSPAATAFWTAAISSRPAVECFQLGRPSAYILIRFGTCARRTTPIVVPTTTARRRRGLFIISASHPWNWYVTPVIASRSAARRGSVAHCSRPRT